MDPRNLLRPLTLEIYFPSMYSRLRQLRTATLPIAGLDNCIAITATNRPHWFFMSSSLPEIRGSPNGQHNVARRPILNKVLIV